LTSKNQQGQLAIVIPLALAIGVAGTLMWGYVQLLYSQTSSNIMGSNVNMLAKTLNTRIQNYLKGPYISCKEPLHDLFPDEPNQILSVFRDFQRGIPVPPKTVPDPVVWTYKADPVPSTGIPCLLGDEAAGQDPAEVASLKSVSILIARIGMADPIGMSSQIQVSITVTSKNTLTTTGVAGASRTAQIAHQYMMRAGRLSNYALVLLQNDVATAASPQINVTSGKATAEFMGSVLIPSLTQKSVSVIAPIPANTQEPPVTFDAPIDARMAELKYKTDTGTEILHSNTLSRVFRQGINFNTFGNYYPTAPSFPAFSPQDPDVYLTDPSPTLNDQASVGGGAPVSVRLPIAPIPMVDPPPLQNGWNGMIFTQPLDYSYVYTVPPLSKVHAIYPPIPDLQLQPAASDLSDKYGYREEWAPANGSFKAWAVNKSNPQASGSYSCSDPINPLEQPNHTMCFNPVAAKDISRIPDSSNIVPSLGVTCGINLERVPSFVYQRLGNPGYGMPSTNSIWDDNHQNEYPASLTIEFDRGCGSNFGCDPVFCGLIATPVLNIITPDNAPANQVYGIYANIVTSKINIKGNGHVVFANPIDGNAISGIDFSLSINTVGQSVTNLFAQFQRLASSTGVNFFTPFYFNYAFADGSRINPNPGTSVFPSSAGNYMQPCMTDPENEANDGIMMDNTTYCPVSSTAPPSVSSVAWGKDTIAMSLTVTQ
jgi:hypothetical protein